MIYAIVFIVALLVAGLWVRGIDYMHENHPDYKGEDLFDEDEQTKQNKNGNSNN